MAIDWLRAAAGRIARILRPAPAAPPPPTVALDDVRRRLEILLAAVHGRDIPIVAAEAPAGKGRKRGGSVDDDAARTAGSDGERIHLPARMDASDGADAALARYRVLALGQAERVVRGTAALVPAADDPLARDLYLLLESAAADAAVLRSAPGVHDALAAERAAALAARPPDEGMTAAEREVEGMLRRLLAGSAADPPAELAPGATPEASLARAQTLAEQVRAAGRTYRGVPAVAAWGRVIALPGAQALLRPPPMPINPAAGSPGRRGKLMTGVGRSKTAVAGAPQMVDPYGSAQADADPGAMEPPDPSDAGDPDGRGGEAGKGSAGGSGRAAPGLRKPADARAEEATYPEWNADAGGYLQRAVRVRADLATEGDDAWAAEVLAAHAAVVRRLRERFERLRAQRTRLFRQRDGGELDMDAVVRAFTDRAAGHAIDDRLYAEVRPARRGLAIALLVDISGSTSELAGRRRIIDIEKAAVLLTGEALDALGDLYAVLTFSGAGADDVRMRTLKGFGERNGAAVRRRVSALQPEGYTRLGAAVRHATALLARQNAGHRLLLILSDGRPNDQDHYQGRYAVEDSRQSIAEARARGIHPFCLTVDRRAASYLGRIFGEPGHVILRHPDQLPLALVRVVRQILANR